VACAVSLAVPPLAAQPLPPTPDGDPRGLPVANDPVVAAIGESNPRTPVELARAVDTLLSLGHSREAREYLRRLRGAEVKPQDVLEIYDQLGPSRLMRLSRHEQLDAGARQFFQAVIAAANRHYSDPAHLAGLVQQLDDRDEQVRQSAVRQLFQVGQPATSALVQALADPAAADLHAACQAVLVMLGEQAVEPLIAALESPSGTLRMAALQVLQRLGDRRAIPTLAGLFLAADDARQQAAAAAALESITGQRPTALAAEKLLAAEVHALFAGGPRRRGDPAETIVSWQWEPRQGTVLPLQLPAGDASAVRAAQLSRYLARARPERPSYQVLDLAAGLHLERLIHGPDRPLPGGEGSVRARAQAAGRATVEEVLELARRTGHYPGAMAAAEILGDLGDQTAVSGQNIPTPLVRALTAPDRRLRLVAARAILKLDPQAGYPGASQLPEVLGFLAGAEGSRGALVLSASRADAEAATGLLAQLGFLAQATTSARELRQLAIASPDVELVLIGGDLASPSAGEVLQQLRFDFRTAALPIGLLAYNETQSQQLRYLAEEDALTEALVAPNDLAAMGSALSRLSARTGRLAVERLDRLEQAGIALTLLRPLAEHAERYSVYEVVPQESRLFTALQTPALSSRSAAVLAYLGTPRSQRALVELASQQVRAVDVRQAAAEAFDRSVRRFGLLLTTDQTLRQYELYNQSRTQDVATQQVLGSLLDSIEAHR